MEKFEEPECSLYINDVFLSVPVIFSVVFNFLLISISFQLIGHYCIVYITAMPLPDTFYCAQQINIPPELPDILKDFTKAAIRTQPKDLLQWSTA